MEHEEITHKIIGAAYKVYKELGFGFLESVYKKGMIIELDKDNLKVEAEKPLKVYYDDQAVGDFYVDLFVEDEIPEGFCRLNHTQEASEADLL